MTAYVYLQLKADHPTEAGYRSLFHILLVLLFALQMSQVVLAQSLFTHRPLIDGDDGVVYSHYANGLYKGRYPGNIYGHWSDGNSSSAFYDGGKHNTDGINLANLIKNTPPLCGPTGICKHVVLAIGMSHWTQEICGDQYTTPPIHYLSTCDAWTLTYKSLQTFGVPLNIVIVDCAEIGEIASHWLPANEATYQNYQHCDDHLRNDLNLTPQQVEVILFKNADSGAPPNTLAPELPSSGPQAADPCLNANPPDACVLMGYVGQIARYIKQTRYTNTKMMLVHSRMYAGYANIFNPPNGYPLNPEPYAYEQGFAMKWLIQAQIDEMYLPTHPINLTTGSLNYTTNLAPWIDWGAYYWASNTVACNNCALPGLTWVCTPNGPQNACDPALGESDFHSFDNTHPSKCGRDKVSNDLLYSYCSKPYITPWFTSGNAGCPSLPQPPPTGCTYN